MAEIVMPRLSDSMEEGTVLRWLKSVGDQVAVGDELVEIETDKANMVYESDLDGTIVEVLAQEGDTLPVGDPIARVGDASEVPSGGNGGAPKEEPAAPEPAPATEAPAPTATATPADYTFPSRSWWRRTREGLSDRQADRQRIAVWISPD